MTAKSLSFTILPPTPVMNFAQGPSNSLDLYFPHYERGGWFRAGGLNCGSLLGAVRNQPASEWRSYGPFANSEPPNSLVM